MKVSKLIQRANDLADDMLEDEETLEYANDALSAIGIEVDAVFPKLRNLDDEPIIPEDWQNMLLVPYMKARIKEKDSSQFEWEVGYEQFFTNLELFKKSYKVPKIYRKLTVGSIVYVQDQLYEVESDDTIYSLAQSLNVEPDDIITENDNNFDFSSSKSFSSGLTTNYPFIYGGW